MHRRQWQLRRNRSQWHSQACGYPQTCSSPRTTAAAHRHCLLIGRHSTGLCRTMGRRLHAAMRPHFARSRTCRPCRGSLSRRYSPFALSSRFLLLPCLPPWDEVPPAPPTLDHQPEGPPFASGRCNGSGKCGRSGWSHTSGGTLRGEANSSAAESALVLRRLVRRTGPCEAAAPGGRRASEVEVAAC